MTLNENEVSVTQLVKEIQNCEKIFAKKLIVEHVKLIVIYCVLYLKMIMKTLNAMAQLGFFIRVYNYCN